MEFEKNGEPRFNAAKLKNAIKRSVRIKFLVFVL